MCGRFALTITDGLQKRFKTQNPIPGEVKPNYNAAPTQQMPVIVSEGGKNKIVVMHWGVIPVWAKNKPEFAFKTFNARAESLIEKPMWKKLFATKRCLVPATGFYEWKKVGKEKEPYYIQVHGREIFAMAGLYDSWTDEMTGEAFNSFTIITTDPNKVMKPIHDRMPVILDRDEEKHWLDEKASPGDLQALLNAYEDKGIDMYVVGKEVGNAKNNSIELTYPIDDLENI